MKYEWKKQEKTLYNTAAQPVVITVPNQSFITIKGEGNPNKEDFAQRVSVLYTLSYQVKSLYKSQYNGISNPSGFEDYTVFPLEGIWDSTSQNPLEKDCFRYTIMIKQPDFITKDLFAEAYEKVQKKKPHPLLKEAEFQSMEDGRCIQLLHIGSYDDEPQSFALMDKFAGQQGLARLSHIHREIYLSDARRTSPEKRKTILRYQVK